MYFIYVHKIKAIAQSIAKILKIFVSEHFGHMSGHAHPKYSNQITAFMKLYLHAKNQNNSSGHGWGTANLLFQHTWASLRMPGHAYNHP